MLNFLRNSVKRRLIQATLLALALGSVPNAHASTYLFQFTPETVWENFLNQYVAPTGGIFAMTFDQPAEGAFVSAKLSQDPSDQPDWTIGFSGSGASQLLLASRDFSKSDATVIGANSGLLNQTYASVSPPPTGWGPASTITNLMDFDKHVFSVYIDLPGISSGDYSLILNGKVSFVVPQSGTLKDYGDFAFSLPVQGSQVPEPATTVFVAIGLAGIAAGCRKRRNSRQIGA